MFNQTFVTCRYITEHVLQCLYVYNRTTPLPPPIFPLSVPAVPDAPAGRQYSLGIELPQLCCSGTRLQLCQEQHK